MIQIVDGNGNMYGDGTITVVDGSGQTKLLSKVGAGSATWGAISGTIGDQGDLASLINGKQDTLVSGTNIKTINNETLLGSGNIDTAGGFGRGMLLMGG